MDIHAITDFKKGEKLTKNKVTLRSFVYLNEQIVEDYISSILGALPKDRINSNKSSRDAKGSVAVMEGIWKKQTGITESYQMTPASLFSSLHLYLEEHDLIKKNKKFASNMEIFKKGDIIEMEGFTAISDKVGNILEDFAKLLKGPMFDVLLQSPNLPEKSKRGLSYLKAASPKKGKKQNIKFHPNTEPGFTIVLQINPIHLSKGMEIEDIINEEYFVLMKITKIITGSSKFSLFTIPGLDIGSFLESKEVLDIFLTGFNKPEFKRVTGGEITKDDFYVSSPALIAEVIGIFT